jgi:hypothetical protein
MIFSDFYKGTRSPLAKLRHHQPVPVPVKGGADWSGEDNSDLLSRDKVKVKAAVKRYLEGKVRNDWEFEWPRPAVPLPHADNDIAIDTNKGANTPPSADEETHETQRPVPHQVQDETKDDEGYQVDTDTDVDDENDSEAEGHGADNDNVSIYSVVSEDPHFRARLDWDSDAPNDEPLSPCAIEFGNSELNLSTAEKRAKHRRELRQEMEYNEGLACFEARRDAWTQARTVRLRLRPQTLPPASQRSPRRFFFRRSISGSPSAGLPRPAQSLNGSASGGSSEASGPDCSNPGEKDSEKLLRRQRSAPQHNHSSSDASETQEQQAPSEDDAAVIASYPVETIVPVPQPILPPQNPLRASIQPSSYVQLYDKLIINNLQPSCPVNLSDMIGACVAGWKRDGEWPPRPSLPVDTTFVPVKSVAMANRHKRSSVMVANNQPGSMDIHARRKSFSGLLTRDRDGDVRGGKGGVRHSLSRALGLGSPFSPHLDLGAAVDRG